MFGVSRAAITTPKRIELNYLKTERAPFKVKPASGSKRI
jgi:hypothetical protein